MTDNVIKHGSGKAGAAVQLQPRAKPIVVAPSAPSTDSTKHFPRLGREDPRPHVQLPDYISDQKLTNVESRALLSMMRALEATGAEWITETQWRAWAAAETSDYNVRAFRIPELLAKGMIEETSALFHAPKYGAPPAPLPVFRLTRQ